MDDAEAQAWAEVVKRAVLLGAAMGQFENALDQYVNAQKESKK